jgi:hypothetical protein
MYAGELDLEGMHSAKLQRQGREMAKVNAYPAPESCGGRSAFQCVHGRREEGEDYEVQNRIGSLKTE